MQTVWGRLIDFTTAGKPIFALKAFPNCLDAGIPAALPTTGEYRLIDFTTAGKPIFATALACCDSVDPCRPRVETGCTPGGGGIDLHPTLYFTNLLNCPSAFRKILRLQYVSPLGSPGDPCYIPLATAGPTIPGCTTCDDLVKGKWIGSQSFHGGSVDFELCCYQAANPYNGNPNWLWFRLRWHGSCGGHTDQGCLEVPVQCEDPIVCDFSGPGGGPINLSWCCGCDPGAGGSADIVAVLQANCYPDVFARLIDFTTAGKPIFATANCHDDLPTPPCTPACQLTATVSGPCACLNGTYTIPNTGVGTWAVFGVSTCGGIAPADITFSCTDNGDGTETLSCTITCGADNDGTASITMPIPADGLDTIDVTFNITMRNPTPPALCCPDGNVVSIRFMR
jgi:hypothetical protein